MKLLNTGQASICPNRIFVHNSMKDAFLGEPLNKVSKMVAGAAITIDGEVMVNSTGKGITATATNYIVAYALEAASADGDIISVLLRSSGVKAA